MPMYSALIPLLAANTTQAGIHRYALAAAAAAAASSTAHAFPAYLGASATGNIHFPRNATQLSAGTGLQQPPSFLPVSQVASPMSSQALAGQHTMHSSANHPHAHQARVLAPSMMTQLPVSAEGNSIAGLHHAGLTTGRTVSAASNSSTEVIGSNVSKTSANRSMESGDDKSVVTGSDASRILLGDLAPVKRRKLVETPPGKTSRCEAPATHPAGV
eukprot:Filipodium_phascolosomae@DN3390_c0_g1_i1.p1